MVRRLISVELSSITTFSEDCRFDPCVAHAIFFAEATKIIKSLFDRLVLYPIYKAVPGPALSPQPRKGFGAAPYKT